MGWYVSAISFILSLLTTSPSVLSVKQLSAYALEWAEYLAEKSLLQHRTDAVYGENIYWSSAATTARAAADAWYSEISDYTDYTTEPDMSQYILYLQGACFERNIPYYRV